MFERLTFWRSCMNVVLGDPLSVSSSIRLILVRVSQVLPHEGLHGEEECGEVEEDFPAGEK